MALLLALLPDEIALSRLRRALEVDRASRVRHQLLLARGWEEMRHLALRSAPQLAIFDPYASGSFDLEDCRRFRADFPSIALLPYADFTRNRIRDVLRLASLGIQEEVVRDEDDTPVAFHLLITGALTSSVPGMVLVELEDLLPARLTPFLRDLLFAARQSLRPRDVARLYHRHPNTLREHLKAAGLPPVNKLIVWVRLFHAARLLDSPARTVENVALVLEYPSVSALRNQLQRYAGVTPQEVRERGGLGLVLAAFRERQRAGRWEAGEPVEGRVEGEYGAGE
jgi:AraC-like DNA-binding protein